MELEKFSNYINFNWNQYKESITEISKNKKSSLVVSDKELFNFDKIKDDIYKQKKVKPTSVDGLQITGKEVNLIEFKSGFEDKISRDKLNPDKAKCDVLGDICDDYWKVFFSKRDLEKQELIDSIKMKAVESYMTLEKMIYPAINIKNKDILPNLIVVIDSNPSDSMEYILGDLAKRTPPKNNMIGKVNEALVRFQNQNDFNGNSFYYNHITVMSVAEYECKINES